MSIEDLQARIDAARSNGRHNGSDHVDGDGTATSWPDPVNFINEISVAPYKRSDVPIEIGNYSFSYAEHAGFDPSITALAAVVATGAALSDDFKLVADSATGWMQSPRHWGLVLGPSGGGKTPAINAMLRPLHELQRDVHGTYVRQLELLEEDATKPPRPRIVIADATVEALSEVLRDNPRGVLVAIDEFESFLGGLDQYKRGAASRDRGDWLRLFDGGPHTVERIQRGSVHVPNFGVSLITATTPTALAKVAKLLPEDGLLQRFLIAIGGRQTEGKPAVNVQFLGDEFGELLHRLYQAEPRLHKGAVPMMKQTKDLFDRWRAEQRIAQAAFDEIDPSLGAHLAKHPTFVLRLALTFHACRAVTRPEENDRDPAKWPLLPETMEEAIRFLERARRHALVLYLTMRGESSAYNLTRDIARTVLALSEPQIARRDLLRRCRAFQAADEREQASAMNLLADMGWLRPLDAGYKKPYPTHFLVNPSVATKFAAEAERERGRRELVRKELRGLS